MACALRTEDKLLSETEPTSEQGSLGQSTKRAVPSNEAQPLSFAFLQGVCSPFFAQLGMQLAQEGAVVNKINFTAGDASFWPGKLPSTPFRGARNSLDSFYESYFTDHRITDIVLFGDSRHIHQSAIGVAKKCGLHVHVFEEGYFRPYWLTLERNGVNANSDLPRDPDWYRQIGKQVPRYGNGQAFKSSFLVRAWHDVVYNAHGLRNRWQYPAYRSHAPHSVWDEYGGYIKRAFKLRGRGRRDAHEISELVRRDRSFYLLPLQLNSDSQIRQHSGFSHMSDLIDSVLPSFAAHAPSDAVLVVKNHPLDPGIDDHEELVFNLACRLGIQDRILFLESGHLPTLLSSARGVVVVNSTVGGSALVHARPTIALGQAIYGLPGLTFQGELDHFWRDAEPPDMRLFNRFRNVVIHTTQVNGGFYTQAGIKMAVRHSVDRLLERRSLLDRLLEG
ncbi:capsule biosynthesis protein CapA [Bordetella petrii]|nr:capsule biosynthesis protein CapA [Bordetella petrii]